MKALHSVAFVLLVVGGLNWLLEGLFSWEVGSLLGGMDTTLAKIVYVLVGLSAVYLAISHKSTCKNCDSSPSAPMNPTV